MADRHVGINVPLFSIRSEAGWGIGEIGDLGPLVEWIAAAAMDRLLLLPLGTMQHGQTSPYSAASTLSIDPIYIRLANLDDFVGAGGLPALGDEARAALARARSASSVDYEAVRRAKDEALALAFARFVEVEWRAQTPRGQALADYRARERWWLDDYALYQALSEAHGHVSWQHWPPALRDRDPSALAEAKQNLQSRVLAHQYLQWIAEEQWQAARAVARRQGIQVFGDLPFVAGTDSAETWAHAGDFMLDVSTGVPPDAFSPTGQDWGLPTYRWDDIRRGGYRWLRLRAQRMAALFDGLRVDHTIGLYRTYGRPAQGEPFFTPPDEPSQLVQGAEVLRLLAETGLDLIAEDLGSVPDFLRRSLAELAVPGCKVLRWERDWHAPGAPFVDPATYPYLSAAMTGTHDTEPLSVWWRELSPEDREAAGAMPVLAAGHPSLGAEWSDSLRDRWLEQAYVAGSRHLFLPVQDVFGWDARINLPGTVGDHNWTWALPWPDGLSVNQAGARERATFLWALSVATGRGSARGSALDRPDYTSGSTDGRSR